MSNPFGKLRVEHDEEDETVQMYDKKNSDKVLFTTVDAKKKKKVRPEEKKKMEEELHHLDIVEEGFSEVKKSKARQPTEFTEEHVAPKESHMKNKGHFGPRVPRREGERVFERHSGTGRGKEVAKGGAGGKYTWENEKDYNKEEVESFNRYHNSHKYDNYYNEDYYYNEALTTKKETTPVTATTTEKVEEKKETEVEKVTEKVDELNVEEEKKEGKPRREKKPKKGEVVEVKEESIVTADSISYAEYREKHSQKNQNLNQAKKQLVVERPKLDPTLKEITHIEEPLGIGKGKKPTVQTTKPHQPSKTDEKEKELNYNVGFELETNEYQSERTYNRGGERGNRGGRGRGGRGQNRGNQGNQGRGNNDGFKFNANDFPELK